jgi:flagellar L-ring protein precursor FlgH
MKPRMSVLIPAVAAALYIVVNVSMCGAVESLYSDLKASQVGDVVTVIITEKTLATNSAKISTSKDTRFGAQGEEGTGALDFVPGLSMDATISRGHDGTGVTKREGSIFGKMAAIVVEVLDNGCLVIKGEKEIVVNDEKEMLVITGIVRPQDITTGNQVYSTNIANTTITYKGKGLVSSGAKPSVISRILSLFF